MIRLYPLLIPMFVVLIAASFTTGATDKKEAVVLIKSRTQSKILLNWQPLPGDISHYVIERSVNGRGYYDAGLVFTDDVTRELEYFFTDDLKMNYGGTLYYRLRVVKMDKSEIITPVTVVGRIGGVNPVTH
jgi:hypothetical protein